VYSFDGAAIDAGSIDPLEGYVRQIAFNLHDGPAQTMGLASVMLARALSEDDPGAAWTLVAASQGLVDRSLDDLRDVFLELRPSSLDGASLTEQVGEYVDECRRVYGIPVTFEVRGLEPTLSLQARIAVFRIAQEALTNVRRHSGCASAATSLDYDDAGVTVTVRDDGCGFDPSDPSVPSWGIKGIVERAGVAGGSARVSSSPGDGSVVTARVPAEVPW
jgi:two-component system sensor histidine kinase DegS